MSGSEWLIGIGIVVGVLIGWWIGRVKGYPLLGAVLGLAGFIGWIIMALIPSRGSRPLQASTEIAHVGGARPPDLPDRFPSHPHPDV